MQSRTGSAAPREETALATLWPDILGWLLEPERASAR
jgi:hypothetical protein